MKKETVIHSSQINASMQEIEKKLDEFRFEYFDSILECPIFVEKMGNEQIWWIWDQGYPPDTTRLIYGYIKLEPTSLFGNRPINMTIVSCFEPLINIWLEIAQRLVMNFGLGGSGENFPVPAQKIFKPSGDGLSRFEVVARQIRSATTSTGHLFPSKPTKGELLQRWFDYYHERRRVSEQNHLIPRYSLRELADDSGYGASTIRKKHIGCPICAKELGGQRNKIGNINQPE